MKPRVSLGGQAELEGQAGYEEGKEECWPRFRKGWEITADGVSLPLLSPRRWRQDHPKSDCVLGRGLSGGRGGPLHSVTLALAFLLGRWGQSSARAKPRLPRERREAAQHLVSRRGGQGSCVCTVPDLVRAMARGCHLKVCSVRNTTGV